MKVYTTHCKYEPGQIVKHRHHDYRGAIYDVDDCCQADDEWYSHNRTQPKRDQPWYHILVDGESHTTYVAEENIEIAEVPEPIHHPMVDEYFDRYEAGKYLRQFDA